MSITQAPTTSNTNTAPGPAPKPQPRPPAPKPAGTPGGIPALPAFTIGAASTTAAVGALGAATGGIGVLALAGAGAVVAGTGAVRAVRRHGTTGMGKMTRTVTKTTRSGTATRTGGRGGGILGKGRGGSLLGKSRAAGGTGARRGSTGSTAARARKAMAARAAGVAAARKNRPASPAERRTQQTAARRAHMDAKRAARTQAAAARRVASAKRTTGGAARGILGGKRGTGAASGRSGRRSPHSRMAQAHRKNQRVNGTAAKAAARRTQRRKAADQRRAQRVMDSRHRRRLGGTGTSVERRQSAAAKRAAKRRRAALWAATGATGARLLRGSRRSAQAGRRVGGSLRDTFRDAYTHLLGASNLLEGLEKARLFNEAHGIHPIPEISRTLVNDRSAPLAHTGPSHSGGSMSNPFSLLPESEDLLAKIQRADVGGMMGVVHSLDTLGASVETMSKAFVVLANRAAGEMPLHPEVGKALEDVHKAFRAAVQAAEQVGPLTRKLHAEDIARHEAPRTGESQWDISAQD